MSDSSANRTKTVLCILLLVAVSTLVVTVGFYMTIFNGGISNNHQNWAEFGSYIGGVLSAAFAFMAFTALLYSIHIQSEELSKTRDTLFNQNNLIKKQNFETTFFQLINQFNLISQQLIFPVKRNLSEIELKNEKYFEILYSNLISTIQKIEISNHNFNRLQLLNAAYSFFYPNHRNSIEPYLKTLQVIIEYIDKGDVSEKDKEFYINIFCTQLSSNEFYLILYHSLSAYSNKVMVELIKKYDFFKYLKYTEFQEIIDDINLFMNPPGKGEERKESLA